MRFARKPTYRNVKTGLLPKALTLGFLFTDRNHTEALWLMRSHFPSKLMIILKNKYFIVLSSLFPFNSQTDACPL